MSTLNNTTEQLMALKALTRTTGVLHEGQILQLKIWPFLLYSQKEISYELRVDLDRKVVEYLLQFKGKVPVKIKDRVASLENDLHWLLGSEWLLKASANGKSVFTGTRKIDEVETAEKKAYTPYIDCINDYLDREWGGKKK